MSGETTTSRQTQHEASPDGIQLMDGESVLSNSRPSWSLWWKQIALAILLLLGGLAGDSAVGGIVVGGAIFAYVVVARMQSRYIVTDERVRKKVGLLSKSSGEYRIADIRSLSTEQSIFERLLGHGTIRIRAGANNEIPFVGVPEYRDVANQIRERQRAYE